MCRCSFWIVMLLTTFCPATFGFQVPTPPEPIPSGSRLPAAVEALNAPAGDAAPVVAPGGATPVTLPECVARTISLDKGRCVLLKSTATVKYGTTSTPAPWPPAVFWISKIDLPTGWKANRYWVVGPSCGWVQFEEIMPANEAVGLLTSHFAEDESSPNRYVQQGLVQLLKQLPGPAIANFTEALRLDPQNQSAYYHRALAHAQSFLPVRSAAASSEDTSRDNKKRALGDLTDAIRLDPAAIQAFLARAEVHTANRPPTNPPECRMSRKALVSAQQQTRMCAVSAQADREAVLLRDPGNVIAEMAFTGSNTTAIDLIEGITQAALGKAQADATKAQADAIKAQADAISTIDKNPKNIAVIKKLEKPVPLHFPMETPLEKVLECVRVATNWPDGDGKRLSIYVDPQALHEADKTMTSPVVIDLDDVPLRFSLCLVCKQLGLAYCVRDGVVMISTVDGIQQELCEAQ